MRFDIFWLFDFFSFGRFAPQFSAAVPFPPVQSERFQDHEADTNSLYHYSTLYKYEYSGKYIAIKMSEEKLTEDEVADLKEAFAMFDINGDGTIELNEIRQVMRKLGQNPTEDELKEMISTVDDNDDHEIDFEEFLVLMKSRTVVDDPEKELKDAFAVFDSDGNGAIDRKELKRLMKKLGQALTEAEVDAMMEQVDSNGDGEISYDEFKAMMQN